MEDQRRRRADLLPPEPTAGGQRQGLEGAGGAAARGGESAMVGAQLWGCSDAKWDDGSSTDTCTHMYMYMYM